MEYSIRYLFSWLLRKAWAPTIISVVLIIFFIPQVELEQRSSDLFQIVLALATVSSVLIIPFSLQIVFYHNKLAKAVVTLRRLKDRKWKMLEPWEKEKEWRREKEKSKNQIQASLSSCALTLICAIGSFFSLLVYVYLDKVTFLAGASIFGLVFLIFSLAFLVWSFICGPPPKKEKKG